MSSAPKLNTEQQIFIIQNLACFLSLEEVIKLVKEKYSIDISKQGVNYYDPSTLAGKQLSDDFKKLFYDTRAEYLSDITTIGVSHQKVRLQKLNNHINRLENNTSPNIPLIAQLLEQAAKEMGNHFTNKRELTGKDGQPIASNIQVRAVDYRTAIAEATSGSIQDSPTSGKD